MKKSKPYILALLLVLISSNSFSQWKTDESKNIKDDIIISYEVIYDRELSANEKKSPDFLSEITIAFNKDNMIERRFNNKIKSADTYNLYDYKKLKGYSCTVFGTMKKAVKYDFKEPKTAVELDGNSEPKIISDFPCEKGMTIINQVPKEVYFTKKIGLRYCKEFQIDGFLMEYPGYSKALGFYTVKAKKVLYNKLPNSFYSLADFDIQTVEEAKKAQQDNKERIDNLRMKYIGERANTFKEFSIKNEKIDTNKMLGDIIVYNFWFTTCAPCKAEIPKLNKLREKYKGQKVHFIAVALDPEYNISSFLENTPLNYEIIPEGKWIAEKFDVTSFPTNIIIDKKGIIQFYEIGYKSDILERMTSSVDKYLAQ